MTKSASAQGSSSLLCFHESSRAIELFGGQSVSLECFTQHTENVSVLNY